MRLISNVSLNSFLVSVIGFLIVVGNPCVQAKELAITFDDSPRFATGYLSGPERAKRLIAKLAQHKVSQTAFFSNSGHLDKEGIVRLHAYADAGHIIANHTHDHANFNDTQLSAYIESFLLADKQLSHYPNYRKWFRFPYLREGNTVLKRDGMRKALANSGYINGYVTIATHDWLIEDLFQQALKQQAEIDMNKMRQFYVKSIIENAEFYEQLAVNHLGKSPKHVLLLHETDTAALFIGDLIAQLREQGWTIIKPDTAYADSFLTHQTNVVASGNDGRIHEMIRDKGVSAQLTHPSLDLQLIKQSFNREVLGHSEQ